MRLKIVSQAPPEITRHPKTHKQSKNKHNPEENIPNPHTHMHTCISEAGSPPTGYVRGKLGGPRSTHRDARTSVDSTPPSPNRTHKTAAQVPTPKDTRRQQGDTRDPYGKGRTSEETHQATTRSSGKIAPPPLAATLPLTPTTITHLNKPNTPDNPSHTTRYQWQSAIPQTTLPNSHSLQSRQAQCTKRDPPSRYFPLSSQFS